MCGLAAHQRWPCGGTGDRVTARKVTKRWWWLAVIVPLGVFALPGAASAGLSSGECTGSLRFLGGTESGGPFTVDITEPLDDVLVIPRSDTVQWTGSTPATGGPYAGSVTVNLPFPLGSVEIESWSGTLRTNSGSGTETYDLPAIVPGGVEFDVSVVHTDAAGTCAGSVRMKIEGGAFGGVVTPIALVATVLLAVGAVGIAGVFGAGASAVGAAGAVPGARP